MMVEEFEFQNIAMIGFFSFSQTLNVMSSPALKLSLEDLGGLFFLLFLEKKDVVIRGGSNDDCLYSSTTPAGGKKKKKGGEGSQLKSLVEMLACSPPLSDLA